MHHLNVYDVENKRKFRYSDGFSYNFLKSAFDLEFMMTQRRRTLPSYTNVKQ